MFLSEWCQFPSAPCLGGKKTLVTARVSMLLKSRASLTCFRACFSSWLGLRTYQHLGKGVAVRLLALPGQVLRGAGYTGTKRFALSFEDD